MSLVSTASQTSRSYAHSQRARRLATPAAKFFLAAGDTAFLSRYTPTIAFESGPLEMATAITLVDNTMK